MTKVVGLGPCSKVALSVSTGGEASKPSRVASLDSRLRSVPLRFLWLLLGVGSVGASSGPLSPSEQVSAVTCGKLFATCVEAPLATR